MIRSLRARLALSHTLPILLLMPVLSLYLVYSLEGFLARNLLQQLSYQARLLTDQAQQNEGIMESAQAAQDFLARASGLTDAHVLLLSRDGTLLASTHVEDTGRIGARYIDGPVSQALHGETAQGIGPGLTGDVAYIVLPVQRSGVTMGALRLSYDAHDLRAEFNQLQWLVLGGVALTAILGLGIGLGLATTITRPLRQLNESTQRIATGGVHTRVAVPSRDEVGALAHSFNQMIDRLEKVEQGRQRQLAAIVHELARPIAGMQAAVETLRDGVDADIETRTMLLSGVEDELRRLDRLIQTLQNLHKRTLHPIELNRSAITLDRVIRASVANYELVAAQSGITLTIDVPPDLPRIQADEDRIIQVLTNLLDNAFKFTPHGGQVRVQAGQDDQTAWVSVADTGVGIAPDELPFIFQDFYRGDASRPPEKSGVGLGLAICREIITAHQGHIEVKSEAGRGACFTFKLPKG